MAEADPAPGRAERSRSTRVKRAVALTFGALLGLLLLAVIVVAASAERWANGYARERVDELSRTLGRPITFAQLHVAPLRGRVSIEQLAIGPAQDEPQDVPALALSRASLDLAVLRTLLSFGKKVAVESVDVAGLNVAVVKRDDGTLNFQHMAERMPSEAPEPERKPVDIAVDAARLTDGHVRFIDQDRVVRLDQLSFLGKDLGGAGLQVAELTAALLAEQPNLRLDARVREGKAGVPRIERLNLTLEPVELAPLAPFVAALDPAYQGFAHGVLRAALAARAIGDEQTTLAGQIALEKARFEGGEPFRAEVELDVDLDPAEGSVQMRNVALRVADMLVSARGRLYDLAKVPRARDIQVTSRGLSFDAIRTIYPRFDTLTAPARLSGPFSLRAHGEGSEKVQELAMSLDLSPADIRMEELFHKPAAVPLVVDARFDSRPDAIAFKPVSVRLADFRVLAEGTVTELSRDDPRISLRIHTPNPAAASLLRLLPKVQKGAAKAEELVGQLAIQGAVEGTAQKLNVDANLSLTGFALEVPEASIAGEGKATVKLRTNGAGRRGEVRADFGDMRLRYGDELHKPKGAPLELYATLSGDDARSDANVKANISSLKVGRMRITTDLTAKQTLNRPESLAVDVTRFSAQAGKSDVQGTLQLTNLSAPRVIVSAKSRYLDLDDFLAPKGKEEASSEPASTSEQPLLARVSGQADVQVAKGKASGVSYENLRAKLTLRNGRAKAEQLDLRAFNGTFSGTGSEIPLLEGRGAYALRGSIKQLAMEPLLAQLAGVREIVRGTLSGNLDVTARDLTPSALAETLTGKLSGKIEDTVFLRGNATAALVRKLRSSAEVPALEKALASALNEVGSEKGWQLADLAGVARFDKGAMILSEPLTANTPQGKITLQGKLGLKSATNLDGSFALTPDTVALLSKGKVKPKDPVVVPFQVTGSLSRPTFAFAEVEPVLRPLLKAYLLEQGERQIEERVDDLLGLGRGDSERKEAPRRAQPKREAKKNLQQEAEKRLRGLFE